MFRKISVQIFRYLHFSYKKYKCYFTPTWKKRQYLDLKLSDFEGIGGGFLL